MRFRIDCRSFYVDIARAAAELDTTVNAIALELEISAATISRFKAGREGLKTAAAIMLPLCEHLGLDPFTYLIDTEEEPAVKSP